MKDYELNIAGRTIDVRHKPDEELDNCLAQTDGDIILVSDKLQNRAYWQALLHEMYHILYPEKNHELLTLEAHVLTDTLWFNGMLELPEESNEAN